MRVGEGTSTISDVTTTRHKNPGINPLNLNGRARTMHTRRSTRPPLDGTTHARTSTRPPHAIQRARDLTRARALSRSFAFARCRTSEAPP